MLKRHERDRMFTSAKLDIEGEILHMEPAWNYGEVAIALLGESPFDIGPDTEIRPEMVERIRTLFTEGCKKHDLTTGERMACAGSILSGFAKYLIRWERHGNFDTPGGLAE